jgi:hypothetical protein
VRDAALTWSPREQRRIFAMALWSLQRRQCILTAAAFLGEPRKAVVQMSHSSAVILFHQSGDDKTIAGISIRVQPNQMSANDPPLPFRLIQIAPSVQLCLCVALRAPARRSDALAGRLSRWNDDRMCACEVGP